MEVIFLIAGALALACFLKHSYNENRRVRIQIKSGEYLAVLRQIKYKRSPDWGAIHAYQTKYKDGHELIKEALHKEAQIFAADIGRRYKGIHVETPAAARK